LEFVLWTLFGLLNAALASKFASMGKQYKVSKKQRTILLTFLFFFLLIAWLVLLVLMSR
jgi:hypothetical protein